ncbi:unnamed protein product [Closterium sp. Yama58-4]|nr:unnamed protein product [Closterium sp. Yama58-4]
MCTAHPPSFLSLPGWTAGYVDAPPQLEKGAESKWAANAFYSPTSPLISPAYAMRHVLCACSLSSFPSQAGPLGWTAGYVDAPSQLEKGAEAKWATNASHSPNLPADLSRIMRWDGRGASLELPGVNPSQDGMLFLTSGRGWRIQAREDAFGDVTELGESQEHMSMLACLLVLFPASPTSGRRWRIQAREDAFGDVTELVESQEHMFAFLYIPFSATG